MHQQLQLAYADTLKSKLKARRTSSAKWTRIEIGSTNTETLNEHSVATQLKNWATGSRMRNGAEKNLGHFPCCNRFLGCQEGYCS